MRPLSRLVWQTLAAAIGVGAAGIASANPLLPPTVEYIADVEITRPTDHSFAVPARYVYSEHRIRQELVGIVTLVDLDRHTTVAMIPRVRTYWRPIPIKGPVGDGRRWVGVEAQTAVWLGEERMLGRRVTKYRVHGTIFDTRTPFEGDVWTTDENIVVRVEGTGTINGFNSPIKVSTVQLVLGTVDPRLLSVPENYARALMSDPGPRQEDY